MNRFALLAVLTTACATSARPIPRPEPAPAQRYDLADIESHDCGMMCSFHAPLPEFHTWGVLELRGASATLTLESSSFHPVVLCPTEGPRDPFVSCVSADDPRASAKPIRQEMTARGSAIRVGATVSLSLVYDHARLELRCTDIGAHLDCTRSAATTTEDKHNWLGLPGHVVFTQPSAPMKASVAAM